MFKKNARKMGNRLAAVGLHLKVCLHVCGLQKQGRGTSSGNAGGKKEGSPDRGLGKRTKRLNGDEGNAVIRCQSNLGLEMGGKGLKRSRRSCVDRCFSRESYEGKREPLR